MGWGLMLTHKKCAMTSNILSRRVLTFYFVVKEIPSEHNIQKFLLKICWISKCSPGEELTPLFLLLSEMILAWKGREVNDKALRLRHEGTSLVVQWLRLRSQSRGLGFGPWSAFPGGASGKEPTCQCRRHKRHGFDPWVGKIPWRRAWQPTLVLPGESHGQRSLAGYSP